jgi:hypothetical protein
VHNMAYIHIDQVRCHTYRRYPQAPIVYIDGGGQSDEFYDVDNRRSTLYRVRLVAADCAK